MAFKTLSTEVIEIDNTETTVSVMSITAKDFWDARHELHEKMMKSMEVYEKMTADEKQALISKIKRAMAVMHDQVEEWLPDALTMSETGENIRVEFNFLAAEIDKEIQIIDQATSFDIKEVKEKTQSILKDEVFDVDAPQVVELSDADQLQLAEARIAELEAQLASVEV